MSISENILNIKSKLPKQVTLVAVSKTKPLSYLLEAYNTGQRVFGENKIQEMVSKYNEMPKDIAWHMIGHIQRNSCHKTFWLSTFSKCLNLNCIKELIFKRLLGSPTKVGMRNLFD